MKPDEPLMGDVCECGHERRSHYGFGQPGKYDTCIGVHRGQDGNVCPCQRFKLAKTEAQAREDELKRGESS